ncbi:hypothetical protein GPJ56_007558 [Histomonas meleagridis]|uniref:uncharacterized protein n=1 Tax=Histomonas meleagridis TaxID=135588 RepID=UPI003559484D|nr:hypothetical protein GPJ56_007558 [Histomonas meleagridis]KAH0806077.1 hypothetical protein GO595_001090 [Histomonas meleagridis]
MSLLCKFFVSIVYTRAEVVKIKLSKPNPNFSSLSHHIKKTIDDISAQNSNLSSINSLLKIADNAEKCQFIVTHIINTIDNFGNDDSVVYRCLKVLYTCLELAHDKFLSYAQSFIPEIESISLLSFGGSKSKYRNEIHILANSIYNHLVSNSQLVLPSTLGLEKVIPNPLIEVSKDQQKDLTSLINLSEDLIEWNEIPQKQTHSTDLLELDNSQFMSGLLYPNLEIDLRPPISTPLSPTTVQYSTDQFPMEVNPTVNSTNNVDDLIQFSPPRNQNRVTLVNGTLGFSPIAKPKPKVEFEPISFDSQNSKPIVEFSPIDHNDFILSQLQGDDHPSVEFSPIDNNSLDTRDFILSQTQPEFEPIGSPQSNRIQLNKPKFIFNEFEPINNVTFDDDSDISNKDSEIVSRRITNNDEMFEPISCGISINRDTSGSDLFESISDNTSQKASSQTDLLGTEQSKQEKIDQKDLNNDMFEPISIQPNEMFELIDDQQFINIQMMNTENNKNGNLNLEITAPANLTPDTLLEPKKASNTVVFDLI